jgi:hypothetical protein
VLDTNSGNAMVVADSPVIDHHPAWSLMAAGLPIARRGSSS